MYCKNCGNKLQGNEFFCPKCGTSLEECKNINNINLYKVLNKYKSHYDTFIFINIDKSLIKNNYINKVRINFMIPNHEKILMVYDSTILHSAKEGIVLTDKKICLNTGEILKKYDFKEFVCLNIHYHKSTLFIGRFSFVSAKEEIVYIGEILLDLQKELIKNE